MDYIEINRNSWNNRVDAHVNSAFYDMESFRAGNSSLTNIEEVLLGSVIGKRILHLQCHFGQDTLSLARLGAHVTGVDLSDKAIAKANELTVELNCEARFICCDIYDLPNHLNEKFDIVYTSYGTIGWLPDLDKWAAIINHFLEPNGKFVFVEFHPVVWMFDDHFEKIGYRYFNSGIIVENESGTYADRTAEIQQEYVMWNHGLAEVFNALFKQGLKIDHFQEYDYSPFNCFLHTKEIGSRQFQIKHLDNKIPMVYSLTASFNP
jgi:SAM-dependent methyltransferase